MKNLCGSLVAICIVLSVISCQAQTNNALNADAFETAIKKADAVQVLDVRTPGEYASGHIANSLQADWNDQTEFERRITFIDKKKPVYVYCQ